jgi:non-heme chloroperoxidase
VAKDFIGGFAAIAWREPSGCRIVPASGNEHWASVRPSAQRGPSAIKPMPFLELHASPHAPGISPVLIHYREAGQGTPFLYLHGGWGYGYYPIDRQLEEFGNRFRFLMPDRSGYGQSTHVTGELPLDFHHRAAMETLAFLDALGIAKCTFWGHSDGAVIAAMIGLAAPERCRCLILEAFHYWRAKPSSRAFFARFAEQPRDLGEETHRILAGEHGDPRWQEVVRRHSRVWKRSGEGASGPEEDFYDGRLGDLQVPALFLHGRLDPRTEPGEMERVQQVVPRSTLHFIENGRHCPHSEDGAFREFNAVLAGFLQGCL